MSPTGSTTAGPRVSVAEVDVLERNVRYGLLHQLDGRLQIVLFRARHAHRVALDGSGHFQLRVLDELLDLLALLLAHADLHGDRPLHLVAGDFLQRPRLEAADIDVALRQSRAQHIGDLAELELVVGVDRQQVLAELDARIRALEVEAVGDLLVGLLDRVLHFLLVDLRDDVEGRHGYCAFTPAARITSPRTVYSSLRKASNSAGDMNIGSLPRLARRSFMSGAASAFCTSALMRFSTSRGVPAGASMPTQKLNSARGKPASAMVGTSGNCAERFAVLTASASRRPSLIWPTAVLSGVQVYCVRPPMVSVSDSGEPLSGTCTASMPAATRNFSAQMCAALPVPAVA